MKYGDGTRSSLGLLVAGFFIVRWWLPLAALFAAMIAFTVIPANLKNGVGPGVGLLSTVAGVLCGVALLFVE